MEALPIKLGNKRTIINKLQTESIMYQICEQIKNLVILTIPLETGNLDIFEQTIYKIPDNNIRT